MTESVTYNGERYRVQTSGRYYQSGRKDVEERLLHRRIWADANGPIPERHHIHHINGDWRDNRLENLECVLGTDHARGHMLARNATPEGYAASLAALEAGKEGARAWHASDSARVWHAEIGRKGWEARERFDKECAVCGTAFQSMHREARYCSSACMQKVAVRRYFTDERTCGHCGEKFMANRHRATAYCSRTCSNRARKAKK